MVRCLRHRLICSALLCLLLLPVAGCEERQEQSKKSPLAASEPGVLIAFEIDTTGSFAEYFQSGNGKAYVLMMDTLTQLSRDRAGENDRVILGVITGAGTKSLLWDGTPLQLRRDFDSPEALANFLMKHSNGNGSRIHDGIGDLLDYVMAVPGVAEGRTRTAVVALTDMDDNVGEEQASKKRLTDRMRRFAHMEGVMALYWVATDHLQEWRDAGRDCGFKPGHFVVESEIVSKPAVPSWDD